MAKRFKVIPVFVGKDIYNEVIQREWFLFQAGALALGHKMQSYMRRYINNNRHRTGGTGKLARAINFEDFSSPGRINWGIGNIEALNRQAPYWHVIATGRKWSGGRFRPGGGQYRPVEFTDGFADPSKRGTGKGKALWGKRITAGEKKPSYIRPIPYISVTRIRLSYEIDKLLAKLARG